MCLPVIYLYKSTSLTFLSIVTCSYHAPVPELDARRAMRMVRSRLRPSIDDTHQVRHFVRSFSCDFLLIIISFSDAGGNDWQLCRRSSDGDAHGISRRQQSPRLGPDRPKKVRGNASNNSVMHFQIIKQSFNNNNTHSSRPDFGVLVYPVITMEDGPANAFSKTNLFGPGLSAAQTQNVTEHYSIEKHVKRSFPPTFKFHTRDDASVSVQNALLLDDALTAAEVRTCSRVREGRGGSALYAPAQKIIRLFPHQQVQHETALYDHGPHAQGLGEGSQVTDDGVLHHGHPWTAQCLAFLTKLGMLDRYQLAIRRL